jgi:hypothetical protein
VSRRLGAVLVLLLAAPGPARAHWIAPEAIVAQLQGPPGRALGVERAARDDKVPRLLVIRVGEAWYRIPAEKRREQAAAWLALWRHNVGQGIVAVLDARTDQPAVRFGPGGQVVAVSEAPTIAGSPSLKNH